MKVAVFLCLLLVGSVMSEDCHEKAHNECGDAMSTYPNPQTKLTTCRRLHMFRSCMEPRSSECHAHFNKVIEQECKVADYE